MKKIQRILALLGVVLLLAMYGSTLVFALWGSPDAQGWLMASLYCTIVIPVLLYGYNLIYRHLKNRTRKDPGFPEEKKGERHD